MQDWLETVANVGRDRLTLVIVIQFVLVASALVFSYLTFRRR